MATLIVMLTKINIKEDKINKKSEDKKKMEKKKQIYAFSMSRKVVVFYLLG